MQFEKDVADPFNNVDSFLENLGEGSGPGKGAGEKRGYGLQTGEDEERGKKRARVDDDSD